MNSSKLFLDQFQLNATRISCVGCIKDNTVPIAGVELDILNKTGFIILEYANSFYSCYFLLQLKIIW
jgi:hypothetical protein